MVILAIGNYEEEPDFRNLNSDRDYLHMIHTFHDVWGYSVFFQCNDKNGATKNELLDPILNGLNPQQFKKQCKCQKKFRYKDKWTWEEIEKFCDDVKELLKNGQEEGFYDSLMFIVSCHGEDEPGFIIDSRGEEYPLSSLFCQFQNKEIPYLTNKPKLFFLDLCRGSSVHPAAAPNSMSGNSRSSKTLNESTMSHIVMTNAHRSNSHLTHDTYTGRRISHDHDDVNYDQLMKTVHKEANFAKIYANPPGYATIESINGGILIRAIKHVFSNVNEVKKSTLDDIFRQISNKAYKKTKRSAIAQPHYENTMNFKISFDKYGPVSKNRKTPTFNPTAKSEPDNNVNSNENEYKSNKSRRFSVNKDKIRTPRVSLSVRSPRSPSQSARFDENTFDEIGRIDADIYSNQVTSHVLWSILCCNCQCSCTCCADGNTFKGSTSGISIEKKQIVTNPGITRTSLRDSSGRRRSGSKREKHRNTNRENESKMIERVATQSFAGNIASDEEHEHDVEDDKISNPNITVSTNEMDAQQSSIRDILFGNDGEGKGKGKENENVELVTGDTGDGEENKMNKVDEDKNDTDEMDDPDNADKKDEINDLVTALQTIHPTAPQTQKMALNDYLALLKRDKVSSQPIISTGNGSGDTNETTTIVSGSGAVGIDFDSSGNDGVVTTSNEAGSDGNNINENKPSLLTTGMIMMGSDSSNANINAGSMNNMNMNSMNSMNRMNSNGVNMSSNLNMNRSRSTNSNNKRSNSPSFGSMARALSNNTISSKSEKNRTRVPISPPRPSSLKSTKSTQSIKSNASNSSNTWNNNSSLQLVDDPDKLTKKISYSQSRSIPAETRNEFALFVNERKEEEEKASDTNKMTIYNKNFNAFVGGSSFQPMTRDISFEMPGQGNNNYNNNNENNNDNNNKNTIIEKNPFSLKQQANNSQSKENCNVDEKLNQLSDEQDMNSNKMNSNDRITLNYTGWAWWRGTSNSNKKTNKNKNKSNSDSIGNNGSNNKMKKGDGNNSTTLKINTESKKPLMTINETSDNVTINDDSKNDETKENSGENDVEREDLLDIHNLQAPSRDNSVSRNNNDIDRTSLAPSEMSRQNSRSVGL